MPDVLEMMNKIGYSPNVTTPEQYADIKRKGTAMWAKVIKDAKIPALNKQTGLHIF